MCLMARKVLPPRSWITATVLVITLVVVAVGVPSPAAAQTESPVYRREVPVGLDLYMPVPELNPLTTAKVALGRKLFFDSLLSRDRTRGGAGSRWRGRGQARRLVP